ncbi:MAG: tetratricopeptide repeat protein, partial [Acidobacteria bacterium]|nr:tetratricopeptide repeat protein [Acidobacteriota bacterium]
MPPWKSEPGYGEFIGHRPLTDAEIAVMQQWVADGAPEGSKDWDFRWQHVYRYVTPFALPKGTTLAMRYTYDNSAENPRNPQQPPRRVLWGQWSKDEMGDLWIQVLTRDDRDLQILNAAYRPKMIAEDIVGYETMIREDPSRVQLHDDVAALYLDAGRAKEGAAHFEASVRLKPESSAAHYNFATALTLAGRVDEAIGQYQQALQIKPDYALAHNNLGSVLLRIGNPVQALQHFRSAPTRPDECRGSLQRGQRVSLARQFL